MKNIILIIAIITGFTVNAQVDSVKCDVARNVSYLSKEEKDMIREINILRSNPKIYIPHIENYIKNQETMFKLIENNSIKTKQNVYTEDKAGTIDTLKAFTDADAINENIKHAKELIKILDTIKPRSILIIREDMYQITKKHANYIEATNNVTHYDDNRELSNSRFKKIGYLAGGENIVGNNCRRNNIISAMVMLLVDPIPNNGHRWTLLKSEWKYVSVSANKLIFLQNFAY
jgi:hypothetical protein